MDEIKNYKAKKESLKESEFSGEKFQKQNKMLTQLTEADSKINYDKLVCAHSNGKKIYESATFTRLAELFIMVKFQ